MSITTGQGVTNLNTTEPKSPSPVPFLFLPFFLHIEEPCFIFWVHRLMEAMKRPATAGIDSKVQDVIHLFDFLLTRGGNTFDVH
jgi:hypothetical protein